MKLKRNYKELLQNTGIFAAAKMAAKVVVLLLLPLYTNILTTEEFGITELAVTYANFIVPVLSLSIQEAVFRFGLDKNSNKKGILSNALLVIITASLVVAIVSPFVIGFLDLSGYEVYFIIFVITMMVRQIFSLFLKACGKNALFAIDTVVYSASLALSNIILLMFLGMRVDGYMIALISANIISITFCFISGKSYRYISIRAFDQRLMKQMLLYSTPLILNQISWWISNSSDRLILSKLNTVSNVGIYSAAAKIPAIISNLISVFIQALVISAVNNYKSKEGRKFFASTFQVFHFLLMGVVMGLLLSNRIVVRILLGSSFRGAVEYLPTLLLASFYLGYAYFFGTLYTAEKKNIPAMISTVIAAVANIVLDLWWIPIWGVQGACVATFFSHFLLSIYRIWDTRKILDFKLHFVKTAISNAILLICALGMAFGIFNESAIGAGFLLQCILYRQQVLDVFKKVQRRIMRR